MIKKQKETADLNHRYGYTKPDDYPGEMYDKDTGLPSFNLFEDRLKMALLNEQVKDQRMRKLKIAVAGIYIENLSDLADETLHREVRRQTAALLTEVLPANYTVACGINYPFWVMMPYLSTAVDAEVWVNKIQMALGRKILAGGQEFRLKCRIGVSLFEHDAEDTVTTMVGKAIAALHKAVSGRREVVYFAELANL